MFSHKKRCFPPGTFLPTPLRVIAIVHLCIVFTVLASQCGYPFMGELFDIKSKKVFYETLMQSDQYVLLPVEERGRMEREYEKLQSRMQAPFLVRLERSFKILIYDLPLFEQAWIVFSIVIPLLLLLRIEGAVGAAWILPMIVMAYSIDNRLGGYSSVNPEAPLFPSEGEIVTTYIGRPLSPEISKQREELLRGWELYLVDRWVNEKPSEDSIVFKNQVEKGEFRFNLVRERVLSLRQLASDYRLFHRKEPLYILGVYLFWNLFFAYYIGRSKFDFSAAYCGKVLTIPQ